MKVIKNGEISWPFRAPLGTSVFIYFFPWYVESTITKLLPAKWKFRSWPRRRRGTGLIYFRGNSLFQLRFKKPVSFLVPWRSKFLRQSSPLASFWIIEINVSAHRGELFTFLLCFSARHSMSRSDVWKPLVSQVNRLFTKEYFNFDQLDSDTFYHGRFPFSWVYCAKPGKLNIFQR